MRSGSAGFVSEIPAVAQREEIAAGVFLEKPAARRGVLYAGLELQGDAVSPAVACPANRRDALQGAAVLVLLAVPEHRGVEGPPRAQGEAAGDLAREPSVGIG